MIKLTIDLDISSSYEIMTHIKYLQCLYNMKVVEEKTQGEIETLSLDMINDDVVEDDISEDNVVEDNVVEDDIVEEVKEEVKKEDKEVCACGVSFIKKNKNRHLKSKTHMEFELQLYK